MLRCPSSGKTVHRAVIATALSRQRAHDHGPLAKDIQVSPINWFDMVLAGQRGHNETVSSTITKKVDEFASSRAVTTCNAIPSRNDSVEELFLMSPVDPPFGGG